MGMKMMKRTTMMNDENDDAWERLWGATWTGAGQDWRGGGG